MDLIVIGKLVNTHGIKGEIRIISDFKYKSRVFVPGFKLYIGKSKEEVTIKSYRHHKNFEMCLFDEYNYINDVLKFKGNLVYINRDDLKLGDTEYLDEDLIGLTAIFNDEQVGTIKKIVNNNGYKLFDIGGKYIPYNDNFIESIHLDKGLIKLKNVEGLI